jgi:hypothetical protein
MDEQMKKKCDYWLTLGLALATVMMPNWAVFAKDCPCLQGKCEISSTSDDHPDQCCCKSSSGEVNHKSEGHAGSEHKKPAGECPCCFSQVAISSMVTQLPSVSWVANSAIRACQYNSHSYYSSDWVLKILHPPSC